MNNKTINYKTFIDDLQKKLSIDLDEALVEDPAVRRLTAIWLSHNNHIQLNDVKNILSHPNEEKRTIFLANAQMISALIPKKSRLEVATKDLALGSSDQHADILKNWSTLNRALSQLEKLDLQKLTKHALFINNGVLTANTVLDMTPENMRDFNAQITIIKEKNANYLLPSQQDKTQLESHIYDDELIALLKKDTVINSILSNVIPIEPQETMMAESSDQSSQTLYYGNDLEQLSHLLGIDDNDSDDDNSELSNSFATENTEPPKYTHEESSISDKTTQPSNKSIAKEAPLSKSSMFKPSFNPVVKDDTHNKKLKEQNKAGKQPKFGPQSDNIGMDWLRKNKKHQPKPDAEADDSKSNLKPKR